MSLVDLPLELVEQIISNICHGTFTDSERARYYGILRQVSRHMNQMLLPVVFSQITLDFHVCHRISYDSQLAAILSPNSPASRYARTLRILCLSPLQTRDEKDRRGSFMGEEWEKINKATRKSAKSLSMIVEKNLGALLLSLKNVQNVVYHLYPNDPVREIVQNICHMSRLNNLTIVLKDKITPDIPETFSNITGLQSLTLQSGPRNRNITPMAFSRLICQNPDLVSLSIDGFVADTTLDALVQHLPEHVGPLRINRLDMTAVGLTISANTLRHFQQLANLDLTKLQPELDDPTFWQGLTTQITKLGIRTLKDHHVDYLLSYRGVKELRIVELDKDLKSSRIFNEILPQHHQTLMVLELDGNYSSDAILMTAETIEQLHQCHNLQKLSIVYSAPDIMAGKETGIPILKDTFDLVDALPDLKGLTLGCCKPPDESNPNQRDFSPIVINGATNLLFNTIKKYQFPNNDYAGLVIHLPQCGVSCVFDSVGFEYGFVPVRAEHPPDYIMHPPQFQTAYELRKDTNVGFLAKTKRLFAKKRN